MKIIHSAALLRPPSGILNQMKWEQEAAYQLGADWRVKMFCPAGAVVENEIISESIYVKKTAKKSKLKTLLDWIILRWEYHRWLKKQEDLVDAYVLRYYVHDPFQLLFVKSSKKPVFFVHHTLEGPELSMSGGLGARIRSSLEGVLAGATIRAASGIIGVTKEIVEYEKRRGGDGNKFSCLYPNGIMFNDSGLADDHRHDLPEILFVASYFSSWHGLDILLDAMKRVEKSFILHLVGDLSVADLEIAQADSRVILHGKKSQAEIREISAGCWGGLSSFALDRKKMREACTLKVREYLMMGLPVYAGHEEVLPQDFFFFKNGKPSILEILDFFESCRRSSRSEIAHSASAHIDKQVLLASVINSLGGGNGRH